MSEYTNDPAPQDCIDWGDPKDVASLILPPQDFALWAMEASDLDDDSVVEPTCDACGSVQDENTTEWCGSCGCCQQHCRLFEDCDADEPEARECDDCGIEDGARWDVGPKNEWSVCDGCWSTFGYDEVVKRNRMIEEIKDLLRPLF